LLLLLNLCSGNLPIRQKQKLLTFEVKIQDNRRTYFSVWYTSLSYILLYISKTTESVNTTKSTYLAAVVWNKWRGATRNKVIKGLGAARIPSARQYMFL